MHTWQEVSYTAVTEAVGGAAAGALADTVLYGMDSAKIRQQQRLGTTGAGAVASLYRGLVPTVLLGSVPVFGTFFLLYAPVRDILLDRYQKPEWLPVASAACAIPATLVGVPSDVLKKRIILSTGSQSPVSVRTALKELIQARGLFTGWQVNLVRDLPFAAVKLSLYEVMVQYYCRSSLHTRHEERDTTSAADADTSISINTGGTSKKISPLGASLCGIASGVVCGIVTCPLDVINTEIKAHAADNITMGGGGGGTSKRTRPTMLQVGWNIVGEQGFRGLFRGVGMRCIILGVGSSIFWPIQQFVAQSFGSEPFLPPEMKLEVYQVGR